MNQREACYTQTARLTLIGKMRRPALSSGSSGARSEQRTNAETHDFDRLWPG